jgi:Amidase
LARICDAKRQSLKSKIPNLNKNEEAELFKELPLLYGLPISIKSNLILPPLAPTLGCLKFVQPCELLPNDCNELPDEKKWKNNGNLPKNEKDLDFYRELYSKNLILTCLLEAGAIPFITSNIPQCLMLPESVNRVWGRSRNPYDELRTPGGSSGGEAALIAARCSPLGIGSDIGGSIRYSKILILFKLWK